jgi:uncharacterized protein YbbC (DUF1343 family)
MVLQTLCATLIVTSMVFGMLLVPSSAHSIGMDRMEMQVAELVEVLKGKRVGMLTNPTGVDSQFRLIADRLNEHPDVKLVSFFAPEHGVRGDQQAGDPEADFTDPITGLPVHSLYGPRRAPLPEHLAELDVMVFDIQDVGSRFYTFVWSMTLAMEACAANGKEFVVLDRPNPIGLTKIEGQPNRFDAGLIGRKWADAPFGVATRHGLTAGELATLVNEEWMEPKVKLTVVKVPGLTRSMTFEETGYPWVFPSPNMPTIDTARVYPGLCVFEGTNLSEGRGTTRPFELVGAPWIDGTKLAAHLNAQGLPGCRFRAAWFRPMFSKNANELCGGIQVHVTDAEVFQPVRTGLAVLKGVVDLYPNDITFRSSLSRLMGIENLQERIKTESVDALVAESQADLEAYRELRARHLLYEE